MNLTLVTVTGERCLKVETFPFTIGRETIAGMVDPADQSSHDALKHISKEHAIFNLEQTALTIADAGSLNGTTCNGIAVTGDSRIILPGDVVSFAQRIEVIVDFDPVQPVALPERFLLTGVAGPSAGNVIELGPLPCRLAESGGILINEAEQSTEGLDRRCCRFALIPAGPRLFLAPLSFSPGIAVNRQQIRPGRTEVTDGCTISLDSGSTFRLTLHEAPPVRAPHPDPAVPKKESSPDEDKTVYLQDATMFMHVFDANQEERAATGGSAADRGQGSDGGSDGSRHAIPGKKIFLLVGLAVAAIVCMILFYRSTDAYHAANVCSTGTSLQCLQAVDPLLARKQNKKISELGKKALVAHISQQFTDKLAAQDYDGIAVLLDDARSLTGHVGGAATITEVFSYVARIDRFSTDNGGRRVDIDDQQWFAEIAAIDEHWQRMKNDYEPVIEEMKQSSPVLVGVFADFYSNLNDNRENKVYYLDKMVEFAKETKKLIGAGDLPAAQRLIEEFSSRHSLLKNTDKWLDDLRAYHDLLTRIAQSDIFELEATAGSFVPQTELFREILAAQLKQHLPEAATLERFAQARSLWQRGRVNEAIDALDAVKGQSMVGKIADKKAFLQEVASLNGALIGDGTKACPAVGRLHLLLKAGDSVLGEQVEARYAGCRDQARELVASHGRKAAADFSAYRQHGGITGQMRMAPELSDEYRRQANLLAAATAESVFVNRTAEQFALDVGSEVRMILEEIANEHRAQVSRLTDSVILDQPLRLEKLNLLQSDEVNGWQK